MVAEQLCDRLSADIAQIRVPKFKGHECLVGALQDFAHLSDALAVNVAVGYIDHLDVRVLLKYWKQ